VIILTFNLHIKIKSPINQPKRQAVRDSYSLATRRRQRHTATTLNIVQPDAGAAANKATAIRAGSIRRRSVNRVK
jgi:hypothetical protein